MLSQRHGLAGPDEMTLEECGPQACGYQKFSNFKFLIAVCIIYAVFSLVVMAAYLLQRVPPPVTELTAYTVMNVLLFAAFAMSATSCNITIVDPVYPVCKRATSAKASIAFAFFTWLAVCFSMLFTYKEWRDVDYHVPGSGAYEFVPGVTSGSSRSSYPPQASSSSYA
jgi:hypothetical protein